jgi:hypothetical protein
MAVDMRDIPTEFTLGKKKFAVVIEIMDRNLESIVLQTLPKLRGRGILALRDEREGRTKPKTFFQIHQFAAFLEAHRSLDIMREDESKLLASRPPRPSLGRFFGTSHDGPGIAHRLPLPTREPTAELHPEGSRHQRFDAVIKAVANHGLDGKNGVVASQELNTARPWELKYRSRARALQTPC